jgi:hypothetical protein
VDRDAVYSSEKSGSSLLALPPSDPVFGFKTPDARATVARAQAVDALDRSWTSGTTRAERFDAFRTLPDQARVAWLSHAVARTLEASANAAERACPFHDHIGGLLGIDVAKWWRPTGANYFDRVTKAVTLAALEEVGGPAFASRYTGLKKAELSQSAERIFVGGGGAAGVVEERGHRPPRPQTKLRHGKRGPRRLRARSRRPIRCPRAERASRISTVPSRPRASRRRRDRFHRLPRGGASAPPLLLVTGWGRPPDFVKTGQRACPRGICRHALLSAAINPDPLRLAEVPH